MRFARSSHAIGKTGRIEASHDTADQRTHDSLVKQCSGREFREDSVEEEVPATTMCVSAVLQPDLGGAHFVFPCCEPGLYTLCSFDCSQRADAHVDLEAVHTAFCHISNASLRDRAQTANLRNVHYSMTYS